MHRKGTAVAVAVSAAALLAQRHLHRPRLTRSQESFGRQSDRVLRDRAAWRMARRVHGVAEDQAVPAVDHVDSVPLEALSV